MSYKEKGMPTVITREFPGLNHFAKGADGEFSACMNMSSDEYPCASVSKGFEKVLTEHGRVMTIYSLRDGFTGVCEIDGQGVVIYKGEKYDYSAGGKRIGKNSTVYMYALNGGFFIHETTERGNDVLYSFLPEEPLEKDRVVKQCYIKNTNVEAMIYNGDDLIYNEEWRGYGGAAILALTYDTEELTWGNIVDGEDTMKEYRENCGVFYKILGPEGEEDAFMVYREKESDFNDWCKKNEKDKRYVPAYMFGLKNDPFYASRDFTIPFPSGEKSFEYREKCIGCKLVAFTNRDKDGNVSCFATENEWKEVAVIAENIMPKVTPMEIHCGRLWCARDDGTSILASSTEGAGDDFFYFSGTSAASVYIDSNLPGRFIGVRSYNGSLVAFKEDSMTVIYGDTASNFSVGKEIRGVGCIDIDSAQVVDGILYFCSGDGFYAYGGGQPRRISEKLKLNFKRAKAFCADGKYYAECADASGNVELLVYDTVKGIWLSERARGLNGFCIDGGELYIAASGEVLRRKKLSEEAEDDDWYFESVDITEGIFEKKGICEILVKAKLKKGAVMTVKAVTEDGEHGTGIFYGTGRIKVYRLPVKLKKQDSYKIRISGRGEAIIYETQRAVSVGGIDIAGMED